MGLSRENNEVLLVLPILPIENLVIFPGMLINFSIENQGDINALSHAMNNDELVFITQQKVSASSQRGGVSLYEVGVVSKVKQILNYPGDVVKVLVEGKCRGMLKSVLQETPYIKSEVLVYDQHSAAESKHNVALVRTIKRAFKQYVELSPQIAPDIYKTVSSCYDASDLADNVAMHIVIDNGERQALLSEFNVYFRLEKVLEILFREIDILSLEKNISVKLLNNMDENKREYYLREQKKIIAQELGETDLETEAEELKYKIQGICLPTEARDKLNKECDRFAKMPYGTQEAAVLRNYLDICISLPWNNRTKENINLDKVKKVLDKEHFGLDKVKNNIIEMLAVRKLSTDTQGQIICLAGPPGIGKTSIAKSIANVIGRKYARVSLGGVHDEAEIRGHRKTYVGAMPGRIISAIKTAKSKNPLILLDEIDKMSKDMYGDPVAALLEALDTEQNATFYDHYIDTPFDLSEILFITTANDRDAIPLPLLDRMEIINLVSYTHEEKFNIAKKHLIPKQLKRHGLTSKTFKIRDVALKKIIDSYTREAGVRTLDRTIATLMKKAAKYIVLNENDKVNVSLANLEDMLGPEKYKMDAMVKSDEVGISTGLAWTSTGGQVLPIEVAVMDGTGKLELTGSLGDVMKESANTAISFIRSNAQHLQIDPGFYNKFDIHVHVPHGSIPKDGPSAGITLVTAAVSALSNVPVRHDIAMTGEITLRGKVLPVGGLKEKTMAAYRFGVNTVIIPKENESDLSEIDDAVKSKINFILADDISTVLKNSLCTESNRLQGRPPVS